MNRSSRPEMKGRDRHWTSSLSCTTMLSGLRVGKGDTHVGRFFARAHHSRRVAGGKAHRGGVCAGRADEAVRRRAHQHFGEGLAEKPVKADLAEWAVGVKVLGPT